MLYDANGRPLQDSSEAVPEEEQRAISEIPSKNFPPPEAIPEWFVKKVNDLGGFIDPGTNKIPRYRIVWGMDETNTNFAMGKHRMKYPLMCDTIETITGYNLVNTKTGAKQFLSPDTAHKRFRNEATGELTENIDPNVLLIPQIRYEERIIGTPLWVVEQFVPAAGFGTPEEWEADRYLVNPLDKTQYVDVLGPYPSKGAYIHWFDLIAYDEEGRHQYHPLNDGAFEQIRANHVYNEAMRKQQEKPADQRRAEKAARTDEEWAGLMDDIRREAHDVKKNKVIIG